MRENIKLTLSAFGGVQNCRGKKREGAERTFRNKEKGKMNSHNTTMHDEYWDSITNKAAELNLSASQYIVMIHNE
ncbi:hypothetical protein [uncultured Brachyspira sp.]|uniref:hypothetical protein n=1 Tax=uncultured Brachyspira sp. TaxID=221953 RepID=UPI0025F45220|nr:hypothetical protein [uncultured Brachyspira sp.]